MKKMAILYYPRALTLQRRALWLALPASIIAALESAQAREHSDFTAIAGFAIFTFAALCFGVWGVFALFTEVALLFAPKRRDDMWSWWFASLSIFLGLAFVLSSASWLWMLYHTR
jgi:predicted permease